MSLRLRARRRITVLAGLVILILVAATWAGTLTTTNRSSRTPYAAVRAGLPGSSSVSRILIFKDDTFTRVVIPVESSVKYGSAHIRVPDRIYFDIEGASLNSSVAEPINVGRGGLLKDVGAAQNRFGVERVVVDVRHVEDYSVSLLPDPYRRVVDVFGTSAAAIAPGHNPGLSPESAAATLPLLNTEKPANEIEVSARGKSSAESAASSLHVSSGITHAADLRPLPASLMPVPPSRSVATPHSLAPSPKVTYEAGLLTIDAENLPLSDILSELNSVMGAEIDFPASATGEPVWVHLGPGPARKILSEVLSRTALNYVIQGSADDEGGIQTVLISLPNEGSRNFPGRSNEPSIKMASVHLPATTPRAVAARKQENPAYPEPITTSDGIAPGTDSPTAVGQPIAAAEIQPSAEN